MKQPTIPPEDGELSFGEQQEITAILENYRNNPSNSNKFRFELFAYVASNRSQYAQKKYQEGELNGLSLAHYCVEDGSPEEERINNAIKALKRSHLKGEEQ